MRPGHKSSGRLKNGFESDYVFIFYDMNMWKAHIVLWEVGRHAHRAEAEGGTVCAATPNVKEEVTNMQEMPETKIVHEKPVTLQDVASPMPAVMPHVIIIGAGFGGLQAARALR